MSMRRWGPIFVVAAWTTLSCGADIVVEDSESLEFDVSEGSRLELRVDQASIEVLGTQNEHLNVIVNKVGRAARREAAESLMDLLAIESERHGDSVRVQLRSGAPTGTWSPSLRTTLEVSLPRRSDLVLISGSGPISIAGIHGEIFAETMDGRFQLSDVQGRVTLRTFDGPVAGDGLKGDYDVWSADGRIRLEGSFEALKAITGDGSIVIHCEETLTLVRDWIVRTSDGSISMEFPPGLSAMLEASSSEGSLSSDLGLARRSALGGHIRVKLGQGGRAILVKTSDGNIHLDSR